MEFIKGHSFTVFCILGIIWLGVVIYNQIKFKSKGVLLNATVAGNRDQNGYYFPVYEFEYEGQTLTIDGHMGDKQPFPVGTEAEIYYLPGNKKGVMSPADVKIKAWQVILLIACAGCIILDFATM